MVEETKQFSDYEEKLHNSIIEEFKKVCPWIRVKKEDIDKAKLNGVTDEDITKQFFATCIETLYKEIFS